MAFRHWKKSFCFLCHLGKRSLACPRFEERAEWLVANILRTDSLQLQIQPAAHRFLGPEQVMAIHKKCGSILGGIHLEAGGFTSVGFVAPRQHNWVCLF